MRTLTGSFVLGLVAAFTIGFTVPTTAQVGFSFGSGDPSGGLSIGVGGGPGVYRPGQQKLHGVTPGGLGKTTTLPKTAPLAPHGLVTNQKLTPHPTTGNGVPPPGANAQGKKIETSGTKDRTVTTGAPKDDSKPKSDAIAPSPSPSPVGAEKLESKKLEKPIPTPSDTPPLASKPKDDSVKHADKPTDAPNADDGSPPVVVIPLPAPNGAPPVGSPPPDAGGPPPQPKVPDTQKAVYSPPAFPQIDKLEDCDDCRELWESILHYEAIIEEDTDQLADREKQLQDVIAERDRIQADLVKAKTAADRTYDARMIEIDDESIKVRTEQNADLQNLIDEETSILEDRIAQYEECYDRYCAPPPPVVEVSPSPLPTTVSAPPLPPPTPTPTPTGVAHSPPPQELHAICGPDITELVFNALRDMRNEFMNNPDKQTAACHALLDPMTAPTAWDIYPLSPGSAPLSGTHYSPANDDWRSTDPPPAPPSISTNDTPEQAKAKQDDYEKALQNHDAAIKRSIKKPWFTQYSKVCAVPREVCGATVEFLGTCQHAQVVNYVQWGMMMSLCGTGYPTIGKLAHAIWNHMQYNDQAPTDQQENMVDAGEGLADAISHDPYSAGLFNTRVDDARRKLQEADQKKSHPEQACELKCELTAQQEAQLNESPFAYHWAGLQHSVPSSNRDDLKGEGKKLLDKALDDAKAKTGR
jgi:hypothetical protein